MYPFSFIFLNTYTYPFTALAVGLLARLAFDVLFKGHSMGQVLSTHSFAVTHIAAFYAAYALRALVAISVYGARAMVHTVEAACSWVYVRWLSLCDIYC